jgi:hypothetical protein
MLHPLRQLISTDGRLLRPRLLMLVPCYQHELRVLLLLLAPVPVPVPPEVVVMLLQQWWRGGLRRWRGWQWCACVCCVLACCSAG